MAGSTRSEWLNRNAYRAFPFEEDSDFSCTNGSVFPLGAVLDMRVCLFGEKNSDVLMTSASILDDGAVILTLHALDRDISVSSNDGPGDSHDDEMSLRVTYGKKEDMAGFAGDFTFIRPVRLLSSRILSIPYGIGVDTLTCGDVTGTGKVRVADGHNTELDISGRNLRLKVVRNGGTGPKCPETKGEICQGRILYFLDGQKADSDGSIWIKGSDGISTSTGTYKGLPAIFVKTSAIVDSFMYRR